MKKSHTNVHFDYGGYYSEEYEWISKNSLYAISFKTSSLEKITYAVLVEKICKKIGIDVAKRKLKLSYNLYIGRRKSYIVDDEDVYVYLTSLDKEGLKAILHVELFNELGNNEIVVQNSRVDRGSSVGVNYGQFDSNGRVDDLVNAGVLTIYKEGEKSELPPVIEDNVNEECENAGYEDCGNGGNKDCENEGNENVGVHSPMDNYVDEGIDDVVVSANVQEIQYVKEWKDGTSIEVDQEFSSKEAVWDLVHKAANSHCFGVKTFKSDPDRLMIRCSQTCKGCKWYLRVAKIKKSEFWSVRVHEKMHTCSRSDESTSYCKQKGTPRLVASVLHIDYPGQLETSTPKSIMTIVQGRLGLDCSYSTALRRKKQHVSDVRGSPETSYKMLFSYLYMLREVNPETITSVELDEEKRFKYLFVALGASIEGFRAMRKVIIVDATFLKTVYGGMLVFATAQDPNHHHYPIAFGVIDSEKDVTWNWFFSNLKIVIPDEPGLVFISDRHGSIIKAVSELYPNAKHGHCVWHLSQNMRQKTKSDKDLCASKFRECAHIYTKSEFHREFNDFRSRFSKAATHLDNNVALEKWARCYFEGDKYNIETSNSAESMNSVFKNARKYHLLPMIDAIVEKNSEWFNKHRQESAAAPTTRRVVPVVENELHSRCAVAKRLQVTELNSFLLQYNVIGLDGMTYLVDLKMKSCYCRCFDFDKYPCVHAIAAARKLMRNEGRPEDVQIYGLYSVYYLIETWALGYYRTIYVVPHQSSRSIPPEIQEMFAKPPEYTIKNGRNQETRYPSIGESHRKKSNKAQPGLNLEKWLVPPGREI